MLVRRLFFSFILFFFSLLLQATELNTPKDTMKCQHEDWVMGKLVNSGNMMLSNGTELYMTTISMTDGMAAIPLMIDQDDVGKYAVVSGKLHGDLYESNMLKLSITPINLAALQCKINQPVT